MGSEVVLRSLESLRSSFNRVIDASFPAKHRNLFVCPFPHCTILGAPPTLFERRNKTPNSSSLLASSQPFFSFTPALINATWHIAVISAFEDAFSRFLRNFHFHVRYVPVYISAYFESTAITVSQRIQREKRRPKGAEIRRPFSSFSFSLFLHQLTTNFLPIEKHYFLP